MLMRLAFSIATSVEPEVLLIDEVLSVGDLAFQKKAHARMKELMSSARLMVLVAHDLETIREMCTSVLWMRQGQVVMYGQPNDVIRAYVESVNGPTPVPEPAPAAVGIAA